MSKLSLRAWLLANGLEALESLFIANDIDTDVLSDLTEEDFREIGLTVGQRKRLRQAMNQSPLPGPQSQVSAQSAELSPERRQLTVMFVDLAGSTPLSVAIDPEELREVMREFQQVCSQNITQLDGFVAQFMGDGVMAYFGYPSAHEDDAERAILAALAILAQLRSTSRTMQARVGIASGLVVVGELISAGHTFERAVVGETPNLAARLQSIAKSGQIVVAETTRQRVGHAIEFESLGPLILKGFDTPVNGFLVRDTQREGQSRFEAHGSRVVALQGRDMELSLLRERWEGATKGEGEVVLLVGEAGIGKSRITDALTELIINEPRHLLTYQCSALYMGTPLWPIVQAFRRRTTVATGVSQRDSIKAQLERTGVSVERVLPLIAEFLGIPPVPGAAYAALPAQQKRLQTLQALIDQLLGLARERPVLMVVEDIHWIDPTTLELLDQVIDAISDARVLLLMTSRPDPLPALASRPHVTRLTLNRLSRSAVHGIVHGIAASRALSPEMLDEITSRTDGVPLYVEELTKAVLESRDSMDLAVNQIKTRIPESLHDSLMARLDRIPELKIVAQTAACIGREFDYELLAAVCNLPPNDLEQALERLEAAELIFRRGILPDARYFFKHALVRDAAYECLLISLRPAIHEAIADALEKSDPPPAPELIAMHAARAMQTERAFGGYLMAGQTAARESAYKESVAHLHQALDLSTLMKGEADRDRAELEARIAMGVPLIAVHGYASPQVEDNYRRALALCEAHKVESEDKFTALRGLWNCLYDRSEIEESTNIANRLVALSECATDCTTRAFAHRALGSTLKMAGKLDAARQALQHVLDNPASWSTAKARLVHGEAPEVIALAYQGWIACIQGKPDSALRLVESSVARAQTIDLPMAEVFSNCILTIVLGLRRDFARCAQVCADTLATSDQHGFIFWHAHCILHGGWAAAQMEPSAASVVRTRAGLDSWCNTGARLHIPTWSCLLAEAAIANTDYPQAGVCLEDAQRAAQRTGEVLMLPEIFRLKARTCLQQNQPDQARQLLDRAIAVARGYSAHWFELRAARDLATILNQQGDSLSAASILDRALASCTEGRQCLDVIEALELRARL